MAQNVGTNTYHGLALNEPESELAKWRDLGALGKAFGIYATAAVHLYLSTTAQAQRHDLRANNHEYASKWVEVFQEEEKEGGKKGLRARVNLPAYHVIGFYPGTVDMVNDTAFFCDHKPGRFFIRWQCPTGRIAFFTADDGLLQHINTSRDAARGERGRAKHSNIQLIPFIVGKARRLALITVRATTQGTTLLCSARAPLGIRLIAPRNMYIVRHDLARYAATEKPSPLLTRVADAVKNGMAAWRDDEEEEEDESSSTEDMSAPGEKRRHDEARVGDVEDDDAPAAAGRTRAKRARPLVDLVDPQPQPASAPPQIEPPLMPPVPPPPTTSPPPQPSQPPLIQWPAPRSTAAAHVYGTPTAVAIRTDAAPLPARLLQSLVPLTPQQVGAALRTSQPAAPLPAATSSTSVPRFVMDETLRRALVERYCHPSQISVILDRYGISTVGQIGWLRTNNPTYWNSLPIVLRGILDEVYTAQTKQ